MEALLSMGWTAWRRKGYLGTDCASAPPRPWASLRCGSWQWSVRNHLLPWDCWDVLALLSVLTSVSCSWIWNCEESVAIGKGISELLRKHRGAVYQVCRAAGLPPPSAMPSGKWERSRTQQKRSSSCGIGTGNKCWRAEESQACRVAKLCLILWSNYEVCTSSSVSEPLLKPPSVPMKAKGVWVPLFEVVY